GGNHFCMVTRELSQEEIHDAQEALEDIRRDGLPNYFDQQRFGSASGGEFMARHLVLGQFEEALRLTLTAAYKFDDAANKKVKAFLRTHWGDWKKCLNQSPKRERRGRQSRERKRP